MTPEVLAATDSTLQSVLDEFKKHGSEMDTWFEEDAVDVSRTVSSGEHAGTLYSSATYTSGFLAGLLNARFIYGQEGQLLINNVSNNTSPETLHAIETFIHCHRVVTINMLAISNILTGLMDVELSTTPPPPANDDDDAQA